MVDATKQNIDPRGVTHKGMSSAGGLSVMQQSGLEDGRASTLGLLILKGLLAQIIVEARVHRCHPYTNTNGRDLEKV